MSSVASFDGAEDVNDFLQRIRELGHKRDKEDEERTRKLEEEILQGRKERQARRAERARSISPTKDASSSVSSPLSKNIRMDATAQEDHSNSPFDFPSSGSENASRESQISDALRRLTATDDSSSSAQVPQEPMRELPQPPAMPLSSSAATIHPSRAGTLSWQRRPDSRSSIGSPVRPYSIGAKENSRSDSPSDNPEMKAPDDLGSSRNQIAQSLASKDPSWFKQTAERGLQSHAYRRNNDLLEPARISTAKKLPLPGLSRRRSLSPDKGGPGSQSPAMQQPGSFSDSDSFRHPAHEPDTSIVQTCAETSHPEGIRSPNSDMNNEIYTRESGIERMGELERPNSSRSLAANSIPMRGLFEDPERPHSPTKGLGGFVQSAMLKRSDSVSKRWSSQSRPGLSRGNSIACNMGAHGECRQQPGTLNQSLKTANSELAQVSPLNQTASLPKLRPNASSNGDFLADDTEVSAHESMDEHSQIDASVATQSTSEISKPAFKHQSRSRSTTSSGGEISAKDGKSSFTTPPVSPSKTMDPKRWSPTKASWLESALNKPETSKPKTSSVLPQPSWMAEISKAKQQRNSLDLGKGTRIEQRPGVDTSTNMPSSVPSSTDEVGSKSKEEIFTETPNSPGMRFGVALKRRTTESAPRSPEKLTIAEHEITRTEKDLKSATAELMSATQSTKHKPATPPKKDFRSTLKPMQSKAEQKSNEEPEFKNVFGKLKRTQTQHYVAPDELKNNILRGKAGLTATGGPQKSIVRDELKESILRQKEAMKSRADLERTISESAKEESLADPLDRSLHAQEKETKYVSNDGVSGNDVAQGNSSKVVFSANHGVEGKTQERKENPEAKVPAGNFKQSSSLKPGSLAARFNPALAQMLARGPPRGSLVEKEQISDAEKFSTQNSRMLATNEEPGIPSSSPARLTHMTKGRARGPKRRMPQSKPNSVLQDGHDIQHQDVIETASENSKLSLQDQRSSPGTPIPLEKGPLKAQHHTLNLNSSLIQDRAKDLSQKDSAKGRQEAKPEPGCKESVKLSSKIPLQQCQLGKPGLDGHCDNGSDIAEPAFSTETSPSISVKAAAKTWGQSPTSRISHSGPRPSSLHGRTDSIPENKTKQDLNLALMKAAASPGTKSASFTAPQTSSVISQIRRSPTSIDTDKVAATQASIQEPPPDSPVPKTSEATKLFAEFFKVPPCGQNSVNIDTQAILTDESMPPIKVQTTQKSIWRIRSSKNKEELSPDKAHILFDRDSYLCTHTFVTQDGKMNAECYAWVGDSVSDLELDYVLQCGRQLSKERSCKIFHFRQGKESSNFIQALGGIIIIRRGTRENEHARQPYMICGRRHLGNVVFDEVDLSPSSLCSGFPYLISRGNGKPILWKGRGCSADELGCARLIGVDIGVSPEIEEVEEGHESSSFHQAFSLNDTSSIPKSADHWRLKASYDNYRSRLFCVDLGNSLKVREISPFCQRDLCVSEIYVVDAFFEIYIVIGAHAQSRSTEFQIALLFAQEYGILSASLEDRPFLPVSTVILEGIPRDFKAIFRKWEDEHIMTSWQPKRSPSLRLVPLGAAIEATRQR